MNQRIKELAEQCYEYDDERLGLHLNKEKFAELIVKECANVAVEAESTGVARVIMIHFGVEE